jgi:SAM-dependent methyltransferase
VKDYKQIWNNLSTNIDDASFYVCCLKGDEEEEIRRNGAITATFLRDVLRMKPGDKVLEIGCGVARIGRELAPYCGEWHGADISGNMLEYAAERTKGLPNVYYHELPDNSLRNFPDDTFDRVYSSIVFMHLDKPDVFVYMAEACRVLKPGGRVYFDTYNLLGPGGWEQFQHILAAYPPGSPRPGHVSQFSTPQEFQKFMDEAGYDWVMVDGDSNPTLVVAIGRKGAAGWD